MKRDILNGPAPTLGLALTAYCLFLWGQNWHRYTWSSLGLSLALVLLAGLLLGLLVGRLARRCGQARAKWPVWLLCFLVGLLVVEILKIFLDAPLGPLAAQLGFRPRYFRIPLALAVFGALYAARGFRLLNVFLLVFLGVSLAGGLINFLTAPPEEEFEGAGFSVNLNRKPNIYLYFLESYHSPYAMRLLYGLDPGPMLEYLEGKGFQVYDRTLSNSSGTLQSMADTFMMRLSAGRVWGNMDLRQKARRMLGGSDDNNLFKMLKANGYHLTFLTMGSGYFFQLQGPNLDATDARYLLFEPLIDLNLRLLRPLMKIKWNYPAKEENSFQGSRAARVREAVERGRKRGGPFAVIFKGGADHTPSDYRGTPAEIEVFKTEYPKYVADGYPEMIGYRDMEQIGRGDGEIKEIIDFLVEADPGAIVILVGDHGTHLWRYIFYEPMEAGDLTGFRRVLLDWGLTLDEVAQNYFGVLLAIRLPGGERRDISQGLALSHVNLFRHVFAYLNDDPDILKTREPALSWIMKFVLGRDNQPVLELYESAR